MREWVKNWVDALRSGKYVKGHSNRYHCLDVLCSINNVECSLKRRTLPIKLCEKFNITEDVMFRLNDDIRALLDVDRHYHCLAEVTSDFDTVATLLEIIETDDLWLSYETSLLRSFWELKC